MRAWFAGLPITVQVTALVLFALWFRYGRRRVHPLRNVKRWVSSG